MRFLLDHGLPRSTVESLLALGIESDHVGNLGMATAQVQLFSMKPVDERPS